MEARGTSEIMRLMILFALIIQTALAQHAAGFAGGPAGPRGFAGSGPINNGPMARGPGAFGPRRGNRFGRFGNSFIGGYWPFFGDYGLWGDYLDWADYPYAEEPSPPPNLFFIAPPPPVFAPPPAPARPVQSVIHEYPAPPASAGSSPGATAFTIALKDGSQLSAIAVWIQQGKLYYVDSQQRHRVLSPDVIDRETTERLNEEKNLRVELPSD
jgi:hypothetical protein